MRTKLAGPLIALFLAGCLSDSDPTVGLEGTGVVQGSIYTDLDADGVQTGVDRAAANVPVSLVVPGSDIAVATAVTGPQGSFTMGEVPLGGYELAIPDEIADTLLLASVTIDDVTGDPGDLRVTVAVDDTIGVVLALAYPAPSIADARTLPVGTRVGIDATALTPTGAFGGRSLYLADETGSLRAINVTGDAIIPGDRVRVLGTIGTDRGQTVLVDGRAILRAAGPAPQVQLIDTDDVPTAQGGALDAALVEVVVATVDTMEVVDGDLHLTVDDGSGPATVVLYRGAGFDFALFQEGTVLDATGVLTPAASGDLWRLMPRDPADIRIRSQPPPPVPSPVM